MMTLTLLFIEMWIFSLCFFISCSLLLGCIYSVPLKDNKKQNDSNRLGYANTNIHQRWTRPFKRADWFSVNDTFYRYSLTTLTILWC